MEDPAKRRERNQGEEEEETPQQKKQRQIRQEILRIQGDASLSPIDKARRIQEVMTRDWNQLRLSSSKSAEEPKEEADLKVSYFDEKKNIFGCKHYQRGCKIQAACCKKFFVCRLCHDEESDHQINRYLTQSMWCMYCGTVQPIAQHCASEKCNNRSLARYYCGICKFHDDAVDKDIYHCHDCNMCRIGKGIGIDRFHCKTCNICLSTESKNHKCIENSLGSDCPVCRMYMFTSREPVTFMRCGHAIHNTCLKRYTKTNFACPMCHKSILDDISGWISRMDFLLSLNQMPEEYANAKAHIFCNDCETKSTVSYHFIGHKCQNDKCNSYNTVILSTSGMPSFQLPIDSASSTENERSGSRSGSSTSSTPTSSSNFNETSSSGASSSSIGNPFRGEILIDDYEDEDDDDEESEEEEEEDAEPLLSTNNHNNEAKEEEQGGGVSEMRENNNNNNNNNNNSNNDDEQGQCIVE